MGDSMPYYKTKWWIVRKTTKPEPVPDRAERTKIRNSLGMEYNEPFLRCRGKVAKKLRAFEKRGDFSHSKRGHLCEECRCGRVAGWGTRHYGLGNCYYHDIDGARKMAKSQMVAIRQGYPLDPIKYKSDSEYIEDIRRQAEASGNVLSLRDDLVLLRTHLQEVEQFWREADPAKQLKMKGGKSGSLPMTDDVKIDCFTKLVNSISRLSRDQYIITEQDYVSVDEVKTWLWAIIQSMERNHKKVVLKELELKDFMSAMMRDMKEIAQPKAGRKRAK